MKVNKKIKKLAMVSAPFGQGGKRRADRSRCPEAGCGKTKEMAKDSFQPKATGKALIVTAEKDEEVIRAARNIPGVKTAIVGGFGVYDLVNCDKLIVTEEAARKVEEVYA